MTARVTWVRVGDRYPDFETERDHFLALDREFIVGVVRLIMHGPRGRPLAVVDDASASRSAAQRAALRRDRNPQRGGKGARGMSAGAPAL